MQILLYYLRIVYIIETGKDLTEWVHSADWSVIAFAECTQISNPF